MEYARRLAQLGTVPSALLRAYRLGQQLILRWAHEEIALRVIEPGLALATSQLLTDVSFSYIDAVSEDVMAEYEAERARWVAHRDAVQRETVEALLRGDRVDVGVVESALGYRLRQHHLGLVLWTSGDLVDVERVVGRIAATLEAAGKPLVVLRDRETAWAWVPLRARSEVDYSVVETAGELHISVGRVEPGESGFRFTHEGAVAAQQVAQIGDHPPDVVVRFSDPSVRAAAMLARDLPATRRMVAETLGGLAEDSSVAARLRETLLAFVQARESYVAAAARLHVHKNTVKYRVDRAVELRGRPVGDDRLDLELALVARACLGRAVLQVS